MKNLNSESDFEKYTLSPDFFTLTGNKEVQENSAQWIDSNGQKYLEIHAKNYYQLGLLEGKYLKQKITSLKRVLKVMGLIFQKKGFKYHQMVQMAKEYEKSIPEEYIQSEDYGNLIDEMHGMADSLPHISYEDILLQNTFLDIIYGKMIPSGSIVPIEFNFGCTVFGARNFNGEHVYSTSIGQNYDLIGVYKPCLSYILHKVGNRPKVFSLRMGATLATPVGINEYQTMICVNGVKSSIEGKFVIPMAVKTRLTFDYSKTAMDACRFYYNTSCSASVNLMFGDQNKILVCETTPQKFYFRDIKRYWTSSNTYTASEMQQYLLSNYSKDRQAYSEYMLEDYYNEGISDETMIKMISSEPMICRKGNFIKSHTIAFFTNKYFGIGNSKKNSIGINPLSHETIKKNK